jgi:acetoin utilization protein AcuB
MNDYSEEKYVAALLKKISLKEVMSKPVVTVNVAGDLLVVEEKFVENGIRHLPVVDNLGKLVGLITQRDLYRIISPRRFFDPNMRNAFDIIVDKDGFYSKEMLEGFILEKVMIPDPVALKAENSIAQAVQAMVKHQVGCIPVVDNGRRVIGMFSRFDFLKLMTRMIERNS